MKTLLLTEHDIDTAAALLRSGALVGIPTETVYGLGANGLDPAAVQRIFTAKGRPQDNPLILHIPDPSWLDRYCRNVPPAACLLAEHLWPGPLTMILQRRENVPDAVTCGLDTVGIRCPNHPAALAVIRAADVPVAAPSGNLSGRPSPTCAHHMLEDMDGRIDAILDGGPCGVGVESTIIDLTAPVPRLLRPGGMPLERLRELLGEVDVDKAVTAPLDAGEKPRAPGMKYRHYAPKAAVIAVAGDSRRTADYIRQNLGPRTGVICFDEYMDLFSDCVVESIGPVSDKLRQAQRIFDALRAFDSTDVDTIFAQCPSSSGLGLAVENRLKKAAGFQTIDLGEDAT